MALATRECRRSTDRRQRAYPPVGNILPMQQILEAIEAGASGDELANLPIPDHYRAAFVRRDDAGDVRGRRRRPTRTRRKSLHIGEVRHARSWRPTRRTSP